MGTVGQQAKGTEGAYPIKATLIRVHCMAFTPPKTGKAGHNYRSRTHAQRGLLGLYTEPSQVVRERERGGSKSRTRTSQPMPSARDTRSIYSNTQTSHSRVETSLARSRPCLRAGSLFVRGSTPLREKAVPTASRRSTPVDGSTEYILTNIRYNRPRYHSVMQMDAQHDASFR